MTMRGPNLSIRAQKFIDKNKQYWLENGKYIADIEDFKVLQNGTHYSLWDNDILVSVASLSNNNEVDDVWVNSDYRGKKIFSMMLWFFKTRLNRNQLILGAVHSKDMQEVVKGLSRFDKKWYNIDTKETKPFDIDTLDDYYSYLEPTPWRLMLENTGKFNWPMFNNNGFVKESYESYID